MSIQFTCTIESGWANCSVAVAGQTATLTASYLTDGLGDLARSVVSVLRGADTTEVIFAEEPGEYRWTLTRVGSDRVRLHATATRGLAADPSRGDVVVLDAETRLRTFAGQVSSEFARLKTDYGADGYEERWGHPYPTEHIRQIQDLLGGGAGQASRPDV